jgi:hypothetical protein
MQVFSLLSYKHKCIAFNCNVPLLFYHETEAYILVCYILFYIQHEREMLVFA